MHRTTGTVVDSSDPSLWYSLVPSGHSALTSGVPEVMSFTRLDIMGSFNADSVSSLSHVKACLSVELLFRVVMVGDMDSAVSDRVREDRENIASPAVVCSSSMELFMSSSMGWVLRPFKNTLDRRFFLQAARLASSMWTPACVEFRSYS